MSVILDELCATTGWHRDHAREALAAALMPKVVRPRTTPPRVYGAEIVAVPRLCWVALGTACGKRLPPTGLEGRAGRARPFSAAEVCRE